MSEVGLQNLKVKSRRLREELRNRGIISRYNGKSGSSELLTKVQEASRTENQQFLEES